MKRVALLAVGSFNPPTIAHLRMLEVARTHLQTINTQVLEGIMSPVADSYNSKPSLIKAFHRIQLVREATKTSDWIRADDWECSRSTWTRTIDVLTHHKQQVTEKFGSDVGLMLVVGGDLIDSFTRILPDGSNLWNPADIIRIITEFGLIVLPREGSKPLETLEKMNSLAQYSDVVTIVEDEVCPTAVSSTRLRAAVSAGKSIKYSTTDDVIQYINDNNLYKV
uniref:Nicotinamide-nucleotide adenylyltransferase n=1 Tax=Caenorhabditis tropicalis TaxID=1561998 RepID=A0A1I7U607_9PELO